MTTQALLQSINACDEAVQWAARFPTLEAAWNACTEPEWMLVLLHRTGALRDATRGSLAVVLTARRQCGMLRQMFQCPEVVG